MLPTTPKLLILDFDGVLAIPYTNPEEPYPQVINQLQTLHARGNILAVASFNPMCLIALERWQVKHLFTGIRAGCNNKLNDQEIYTDQVHRIDLQKSKQIINLLDNELKYHQHLPVLFLDDDPKNIENVNDKLHHVETILIDNSIGLFLENN